MTKAKRPTLTDQVRSGDYRARQEALLFELTDALDKARERGDFWLLPQLASQIRELVTLLEGLPSVEPSRVDDLVAYRAKQRAETDARMRAKQRRKGRGD